jgi:hypothetical protein
VCAISVCIVSSSLMHLVSVWIDVRVKWRADYETVFLCKLLSLSFCHYYIVMSGLLIFMLALCPKHDVRGCCFSVLGECSDLRCFFCDRQFVLLHLCMGRPVALYVSGLLSYCTVF